MRQPAEVNQMFISILLCTTICVITMKLKALRFVCKKKIKNRSRCVPRNLDGWTLLQMAARMNLPQVVGLMIAAGSDCQRNKHSYCLYKKQCSGRILAKEVNTIIALSPGKRQIMQTSGDVMKSAFMISLPHTQPILLSV